MKIHHLSCGTFCPRVPGMHEMVCHCLLIETAQGLVLVDSGYGTQDVLHPVQRLGLSPFLLRASLKLEETAITQIKTLGFRPEDVRHIVVTHLDPDHIGGLSDFPWADVHIHETELKKGISRRTRKIQISHGVKWKTYQDSGESWANLQCIQNLKGIPPEILLIPLLGHTAGHCGVAVQEKDGWLLHAGDSYFDRIEIAKGSSVAPLWLQVFESGSAFDNDLRLANQKNWGSFCGIPNTKSLVHMISQNLQNHSRKR